MQTWCSQHSLFLVSHLWARPLCTKINKNPRANLTSFSIYDYSLFLLLFIATLSTTSYHSGHWCLSTTYTQFTWHLLSTPIWLFEIPPIVVAEWAPTPKYASARLATTHSKQQSSIRLFLVSNFVIFMYLVDCFDTIKRNKKHENILFFVTLSQLHNFKLVLWWWKCFSRSTSVQFTRHFLLASQAFSFLLSYHISPRERLVTLVNQQYKIRGIIITLHFFRKTHDSFDFYYPKKRPIKSIVISLPLHYTIWFIWSHEVCNKRKLLLDSKSE